MTSFRLLDPMNENVNLLKIFVKFLNGCFKKTKHTKFSEKTNISYPLIRTRNCAYQGVRNVRFCGKFGMLCFLETRVWRFALLPYYRLSADTVRSGALLLRFLRDVKLYLPILNNPLELR